MADASTSSRRNRFKVKRVDTVGNAADDDGDDFEVNSLLEYRNALFAREVQARRSLRRLKLSSSVLSPYQNPKINPILI